MVVEKLPVRKQVREVLVSRYGAGKRPVSWDERREGVEVVRTADGELVCLSSSGQQSSPDKSWELLLTEEVPLSANEIPPLGDVEVAPVAYRWTLYGIGKS